MVSLVYLNLVVSVAEINSAKDLSFWINLFEKTFRSLIGVVGSSVERLILGSILQYDSGLNFAGLFWLKFCQTASDSPP